jgi:hypothetical protein
MISNDIKDLIILVEGSSKNAIKVLNSLGNNKLFHVTNKKTFKSIINHGILSPIEAGSRGLLNNVENINAKSNNEFEYRKTNNITDKIRGLANKARTPKGMLNILKDERNNGNFSKNNENLLLSNREPYQASSAWLHTPHIKNLLGIKYKSDSDINQITKGTGIIKKDYQKVPNISQDRRDSLGTTGKMNPNYEPSPQSYSSKIREAFGRNPTAISFSTDKPLLKNNIYGKYLTVTNRNKIQNKGNDNSKQNYGIPGLEYSPGLFRAKDPEIGEKNNFNKQYELDKKGRYLLPKVNRKDISILGHPGAYNKETKILNKDDQKEIHDLRERLRSENRRTILADLNNVKLNKHLSPT